MNKHSNFATNLKNIRTALCLSLSEFSRELGIPKSTLQSVLADGHTSLDTAIRISDSLALPLDTLTNATLTPKRLRLLADFLTALDWYHDLSSEKQRELAAHLDAIFHLLEEDSNE